MEKTGLGALRKSTILLFAALLLASCGGGGGGGDNGGNDTPDPPPPPPPPPPPASFGATFSEIQANVFTPTCATSGCHTGAAAPQGLRLDEASSYGLLVGVPSSEDPSVLRVAAGDPDNSYLVQKLEGTASGGEQMPLGGPPLDPAVINIIRQWISDGAIDDRAASSEPVRVTSLSPQPDSTLDAQPPTILAQFDRDLDASTVNANTFILEGSGGDATFGDGNEVPVTAASVSVPTTNPASAVFDLEGVALADDTYRVLLLGSGASIILDLDANALDGEFSGDFPSGDGAEGGDFEAQFTLDTTVPAGATLDEIQVAVFSPICSTCHTGPTGDTLPSGMDLSSADASFASLVGTPSLQEPSLMRVAPGDPDNSYLVHKIEGTALNGGRMPLGQPPLDAATIEDIREWIANGAER